ncbi:MAG TPA: aminomethyl-transferring glycine dehydrogenase subunit GcvPA [Anaerolineae bacterium]|nr:aminomethyl-transferring glycine dehydrogenase subunit GcvPA [Anaerolineae bacterium]
MTYIPHTDANRAEMLKAIGVKSLKDLFPDVPAQHKYPKLTVPAALSEMETWWEMQGLSEANADVNHYACFLGAGAYNHYSPHTVDYVLRRGEFYTAYTPYQPEVSQGTLQAMFEYQSMICQLTGMDVSNASHYDGATSLAEGVLMSMNTTKGNRNKIVMSPLVHPQYRAVVRTYTQGMDVSIVGDDNLKSDLPDLIKLLDDRTAALVIQDPNFLGQLEDINGLADKVHAVGALLIVVTDPIALGLFTPPGEYGADIVCAEGQSLGIPLSYGGPYLGIFATKNAYVRKMAGRLVGETVDSDGTRGYVLTLSTREQHIRREKATSNICTNQGLYMLAAAVYMATLGKCGLEQVARLCWHKSHYAAKAIGKLKGYKVITDKPFFKEFVVKLPKPVSEVNEFLLEEFDILGGYDLGQDYPHLKNHMLIAVTETNTQQEIDDLVEGLKQVMEQ